MEKTTKYLIINIIFFSLIALSFLYIFFSGGKFIPSNTLVISSENHISTGLTRSFYEILNLNFEKANEYNIYGMRVFIFFFTCMLFRVIFQLISFISKDITKLILADTAISVVIFVYSFLPFFMNLLSV